jgi:exodeoxyribonuclease X
MSGMDLSAPWTLYQYAVVDVEGNGQQPPDLVELAIVPIIDRTIGQPRQWLVKPPRPITPLARRFHKISDADVADCPSTSDVAVAMRAALSGPIFVAHNAHVDLDVVGRELGIKPPYVIDTLKLARRLAPGQISYKLGHLVETFKLALLDGGVPAGMVPHRAGYDALMCARLLKVLAESVENTTLLDLLDHHSATPPEDGDAQALF